ncbi:hypothetical protein SteCoe_10779 [Stentor coeruleus]|uniref:Potassium channel domain-containing protein n=1 Tax=Stentor coeruleus TaxID=5963 RepID=A0A1R2CEU8_9CILI|nr:hypothetical protein SteCoe_10779 [Stentor coeruleus]
MTESFIKNNGSILFNSSSGKEYFTDDYESQNLSFFSIEKQERQFKVKYHLKLLNQWKMFRFLSALFGTLAIIPATISYESSYSADRTYNNCTIITENQYFLCLMTLIFSYTGILLQIPFKILYYKWLAIYPLTFTELAPTFKPAFFEITELMRKRKPIEYIKGHHTYLVIILFLIFPYPGFNTQIHIPQQINYIDYSLCYYLEEIFYFIMFLRPIYLAFTIFSYGHFHNTFAFRARERYRVKDTIMFHVKCYAWLHPKKVLFFVFFIPGILFFSIGLRIFERMIKFRKTNFESFENSIWCIYVTIFTIGYGDIIPTSVPSRIVIFFSLIWARIILSMTLITVRTIMKLSPKEIKAYNAIVSARERGCFITDFAYERINRDGKIRKWETFLRKIMKFFRVSRKRKLLESVDLHTENLYLEGQIEKVGHVAEAIQLKLERLLKDI